MWFNYSWESKVSKKNMTPNFPSEVIGLKRFRCTLSYPMKFWNTMKNFGVSDLPSPVKQDVIHEHSVSIVS